MCVDAPFMHAPLPSPVPLPYIINTVTSITCQHMLTPSPTYPTYTYTYIPPLGYLCVRYTPYTLPIRHTVYHYPNLPYPL